MKTKENAGGSDSLDSLVRSWRGKAGDLTQWIKQFEDMERQYGGYQNTVDIAERERSVYLKNASRLSAVIKANS